MPEAPEHPTYEPTEAPAAPDDGSRFALSKTSAGWSSPEGVAGVVAHEYQNLLGALKAAAQDHVPALVEVKLKSVRLTKDGYELVERGVLTGVPEYVNRRPVQRWRKLSDGAFLDSFFLGQDAWAKAPDMEAFEALLATAERYEFRGRALRLLNDAVAVGCALRAGLSVGFDQLPYPPS
jgi:hypothetical protein